MSKQTRQQIVDIRHKLNSLVDQIEIERQEIINDDNTVLFELVSRRTMLEEELSSLLSQSLKVNNSYTPINYIIEINGVTRNLTIVAPHQANPLSGAISYDSPLALALVGHTEGEIVSFATPRGVGEYRIVRVY